MGKTLAQRFDELKRKVGGNREKQGFEWTFGATPEERIHVTRPGKSIIRALSEVNFALQLNKKECGKYDSEIDSAIAVLEASLASEGVLTNSACARAEEKLMPLADASKEYELIYIGHAHIDMNWMWGWQETVASALATFRTILNLMKEYPEFTFMQSQASCYQIVEKYDPAMMDEIKARIKEGRWEVTASAWVETDKNMPDTESLLHHVSVTRDYLKKVWDIDPNDIKLDFSPDTFGHSRHIPEIDSFSGLKYYYHCRGLSEGKVLYRYKAPSGKEVLMYKEPYWYNSAVNPDNGTGLINISELCAGFKTGLIVYGVGDHGGGPTRRDVENVIEMKKWPIYPSIRFGRLVDFFEKAEKEVYDKLPVVDHELNYFAAGCYTTQSRIKLANRKSELSLNDATKMTALAHFAAGAEYPAERFEKAWQDVLFTHFHDILTGSCVQESREHAMGLFADALAYTQSAENNALRVITENTDTSMFECDTDIAESQSEGAGVGYGIASYAGVPNPERGAGRTRVYTVFNTATTDRDEPVEVTMWDYAGDLRRLEAVDTDGNHLEMVIAPDMPEKYWDHWFVKLWVRVKAPALGYTTFALREKDIDEYVTYRLSDERTEEPRGGAVLENDFVRAEFDNETGALISLIDKENGKEKLAAPAGLFLIDTEHATSSAWNIGRYLGMKPVSHNVKFKTYANALIQGIEMEQKVMNSAVKTVVTLGKTAKELKYSFEIDWNEAAKQQDTVPVLAFRVPVSGKPEKALCDVPAGFTVRKADDIDIPCSTYCAVWDDSRMLALAADCKYGYRIADGVLTCTLINTASNPDPYPERGIHRINLFVALGKKCGFAMKKHIEALNRPMTAMPTKARTGKLPAEMRLMEFSSNSSVLSSVEMTGEDTLRVRVYEVAGKEDEICVNAPFMKEPVKFKAQPCSISETDIKI